MINLPIKERRKELRLKQCDVARILRIAAPRYNWMENGRAQFNGVDVPKLAHLLAWSERKTREAIAETEHLMEVYNNG